MAHVEIQRARTTLGIMPEQANKMIHFLNNRTREELAALEINSRIDTILTAKKVLTLRNFTQTLERKCEEMKAEIDEFRAKMTVLQDKGLPSLVIGTGQLLSYNQYITRFNNYVENQITASRSSTKEAGPPSGQSLYEKLENLFFIEHEIKHLFEVPPNFYRYTEADGILVKIRRHQLPPADWW